MVALLVFIMANQVEKNRSIWRQRFQKSGQIHLCDFAKRCSFSIRLNTGIASVQARVAKKNPGGLGVMRGVSIQPSPRPNSGWVNGFFCAKRVGWGGEVLSVSLEFQVRKQCEVNRDYFMVGECVLFLFTSCEESQTNERVIERVSLRFFTTSE